MTKREKTLSIIVLIVIIIAFFLYGGLGYIQSLIFAPEEELVQDLVIDAPPAPQFQPQSDQQFTDPVPVPVPEITTAAAPVNEDDEEPNVKEFTATDNSAAAQKAREKVLADINIRQTLEHRAAILVLQNQIDNLLAERQRLDLELAKAKLEFERDKLQLQGQTDQIRLTSKIALDDLKRGGPVLLPENARITRTVKLLGSLPSGEVVLSVQGQTVRLLPGQEDNGVKVTSVSNDNQTVRIVVDGEQRTLSSSR